MLQQVICNRGFSRVITSLASSINNRTVLCYMPDHPKTSVKATDFVVGRDVTYELRGDKGKLKTRPVKR